MKMHEFTEISSKNFLKDNSFVDAGQNISELMKQISNNILLQKEQITNAEVSNV